MGASRIGAVPRITVCISVCPRCGALFKFDLFSVQHTHGFRITRDGLLSRCRIEKWSTSGGGDNGCSSGKWRGDAGVG